MNDPRLLSAVAVIGVIFLISLGATLKGLFTPKQSLPDLETLLKLFQNADPWTRVFLVFTLVWPIGSKKAQMMLVVAVTAVIAAFAKLIGGHNQDGSSMEKILKWTFEMLYKLLRGVSPEPIQSGIAINLLPPSNEKHLA